MGGIPQFQDPKMTKKPGGAGGNPRALGTPCTKVSGSLEYTDAYGEVAQVAEKRYVAEAPRRYARGVWVSGDFFAQVIQQLYGTWMKMANL